jgi:hypothetical protein
MILLLLALLVLAPISAHADQIVLKDGTVVKGELVDYQGGVYTVKVGKFLKNIPESRIADVRPESGAPATSPAVAPPASASLGAAPGVPLAPYATPSATPAGRPAGAPAPSSLFGGTARPAHISLPAMPMMPALGGSAPSAQQVQEALRGMGGGDPQISQAVQQIMSGGQIDMGQLQQLQNNPAMQRLVERFRDPAYQRSLLEGIGELQEKGGARNPMADQLRGLFDQLNAAGQDGGAPGR